MNSFFLNFHIWLKHRCKADVIVKSVDVIKGFVKQLAEVNKPSLFKFSHFMTSYKKPIRKGIPSDFRH